MPRILPAAARPAASAATVAILALAPAAAQAHETRLDRIAAFFAEANVVSGPELVDCTLSGGTGTTCFQITVTPTPQDYTPGPWCPQNISDGAEQGGIWLEGGEVYDVDGAFIEKLAEFYGDTEWQLFDPETGAIRFTGTLEACQAAARPDVAEEYNNYCVECLPEYMPDGLAVTYTIPLEPVVAARVQDTRHSGSGVAHNGVRLDGPAPVDAILGAHTIAPFDDCGGHVNPHVGYHYHAVTDCLDGALATGGEDAGGAEASAHGRQIGIAMDGYGIFPHLLADGTEPKGLDACNGHAGEGLGYHYHAGAAGSNAILGCLKAEAGCVELEGGRACDASKRPPRP